MIKADANIVVRVAVLVVLLAVAAAAAEHDKEKASVAAAEKWIALIDAGKFADSWEETAASFKAKVKKEEWSTALEESRRSLGPVVSRKLQARYHSRVPGSPDAELASVLFEANRTNTKMLIETVILVNDRDGQWRVTDYFPTLGSNYLPGLMALLLLFVIIGAWYMELKPEFRSSKMSSDYRL